MVTIIILAHNQLASTKRCLNSLFKYTQEPYDLVLVDNGSTDGTREYFEHLKSIEKNHKIYLFNYDKNNGFIIPNNLAMDFASDNDVLLLNNDIEFLELGWLSKLKDALEPEEIGLSYPLNRTRGIKYFGGLIKDKKESLLNWDVDDRNIEPTWAQFSCVLIKRKVIDLIGVLDLQFSPGYFEDVDYSLRIKQAGFKLKLVSEVIVEHYQSVTTKSMKLDIYRYSNREKFYKKWKII